MRTSGFVSLVLIIAVCVVTPVGIYAAEVDAFQLSEKNFETPEAAIRHFTERLAANGIMGAFEACAINEGDKFDFAAFCRNIKAMELFTSLAPSKYPMLAQMNRIVKMTRLSQQIKIIIYSLLTGEKLDENIISVPGDERIDAFVKNVDPRELKNLKVIKIKLPASAEFLNSEDVKRDAIKYAKIVGADDSTERLVLYRLGSVYYWGGMRLYKYDKYWRIESLFSFHAERPLAGQLERITPEGFEKLGK
jgi:hypothetical protein